MLKFNEPRNSTFAVKNKWKKARKYAFIDCNLVDFAVQVVVDGGQQELHYPAPHYIDLSNYNDHEIQLVITTGDSDAIIRSVKLEATDTSYYTDFKNIIWDLIFGNMNCSFKEENIPEKFYISMPENFCIFPMYTKWSVISVTSPARVIVTDILREWDNFILDVTAGNVSLYADGTLNILGVKSYPLTVWKHECMFDEQSNEIKVLSL